jgi:predicted enzyme related to lactoylglutathione lyase
VLFAGVATGDLEAAVPWYEALFGRGFDIVAHDTEVMWRISDGGWLYLVADPARAGQSLVALTVPDLEAALDEVAARGLDRPETEIVNGGGRKATFIDPEGNAIAFIEITGQDG